MGSIVPWGGSIGAGTSCVWQGAALTTPHRGHTCSPFHLPKFSLYTQTTKILGHFHSNQNSSISKRFHIVPSLELLRLLESWYSQIQRVRGFFGGWKWLDTHSGNSVTLEPRREFVIFALEMGSPSSHSSEDKIQDWFLSHGGPWMHKGMGYAYRFSNNLFLGPSLLLMALTKS